MITGWSATGSISITTPVSPQPRVLIIVASEKLMSIAASLKGTTIFRFPFDLDGRLRVLSIPAKAELDEPFAYDG
jgi:hypothetical protein